MSFRDELQDIQNNINKPVPVDEKEYQRKLNQVYDEIKKIIRIQVKQQAVKEKTDVLCGWVKTNSIGSLETRFPSGVFAFLELCKISRKESFFNIYYMVSLTGLGKRVFRDLEEKAREDEISLSILLVKNKKKKKRREGTMWEPEIWEYDTFHKWISKSAEYTRWLQSSPIPEDRRNPVPCIFLARYEIHL